MALEAQVTFADIPADTVLGREGAAGPPGALEQGPLRNIIGNFAPTRRGLVPAGAQPGDVLTDQGWSGALSARVAALEGARAFTVGIEVDGETVTAVGVAYPRPDGRWTLPGGSGEGQEFELPVLIEGQPRTLVGVASQAADGTWSR